MRTGIALASALASLAIASACASTDDAAPVHAQPPAPVSDGGSDADAKADVRPVLECSLGGWCATILPDEDLVFRDVTPFEDAAFAIAESASEGIKVLEWTKSTNRWAYVDDGSQNVIGLGTFAGRIYAPNVDEVYFTVGPSHVFHGKRSGGAWTWTNQSLPDNISGHTDTHGNPIELASDRPIATLGVWGTGEGDVYAYYGNTIFRLDAATRTFAAVYVADDLEAADEHVFFTSAHGSGPDDVWFVGARERASYGCPLVVRKSAAGWARVADAVVSDSNDAPCAERPGTLYVGGAGRSGWLVDVARVTSTEYVALYNRAQGSSLEDVYTTTIRVTSDGYSFEQSLVPVSIADIRATRAATALWRAEGGTWFTSWGLVLHGSDDGTFWASPLKPCDELLRCEGPVIAPMYRIRGTSNRNLWAVGARHAFHKTTP